MHICRCLFINCIKRNTSLHVAYGKDSCFRTLTCSIYLPGVKEKMKRGSLRIKIVRRLEMPKALKHNELVILTSLWCVRQQHTCSIFSPYRLCNDCFRISFHSLSTRMILTVVELDMNCIKCQQLVLVLLWIF